MRKKYFLILSIAFFLLKDIETVGAQQIPIDTSQTQTIRIDPANVKGTPVGKLFEKVEFVPLETTKESTFGVITQLDVLDDRYLIYDRDTKSILIFSSEGKFINKIDGTKIPGNTEIKGKEIKGFELKKMEKQMVIAALTSSSRFFFDHDGNYLNQALAPPMDFPKYPIGTGKNYFQKFYVKNTSDTIVYELALVSPEQNVKPYFPFIKTRHLKDQFISGGENYSFNSLTGELYFTSYYNYTIYKGTENGLIEKYKLIFPLENSLPTDFLTNKSYVDKRIPFFKSNPKVIYSISNVMVIGDYLMFKISNFGGGLKNMLCLNLKNFDLISLNDLERDKTSNFLPVTDDGVGYDFANKGFLLNKNGFLYSSYSSHAMFKLYGMIPDNQKNYPKVMTNYFKNENSKSNPIIVKLKIKK
ncbi:6-bladed beta-propeller protein [Chryseobacterium sp. 52]|nr:6-bladed beta-propeller protein [Chryseobacterium sp. 52]